MVKELTKVEMKLKSSLKAASDFRERGQTRPPSESQNPKDKCHKSKGSGTGMANPIPRKAPKPSRDIGILYDLCNTYDGANKSHITSDCKRWTGADKDHSEWRGRTASAKQPNSHSGGDDIKSLMAQQADSSMLLL